VSVVAVNLVTSAADLQARGGRARAAGWRVALLGTTLTSYVYVWETTGRGVGEPGLPEGSP